MVAPVDDLSIFVRRIDELGKVLHVDVEQRLVTLWISPGVQQELAAESRSSPSFGPGAPFGPTGRPQ
jgi:hypothetical protein